LFWSLTASPYHVAHCVQGTVPGCRGIPASNYVLCRVVWADGGHVFVAGLWFDPWCELAIEPGDMAGTPLRIRCGVLILRGAARRVLACTRGLMGGTRQPRRATCSQGMLSSLGRGAPSWRSDDSVLPG
jgi:hypothetical protein